MDPKKVKELVKCLTAASELCRQMAGDACRTEQPYDVYLLIKESMALEGKANQIKRRWTNEAV